MNHNLLTDEDFCKLSPVKVFGLSIATFGLYLVYWYEMQYAKSKKIQRSPFVDFLKSYFFIIFSFKLSEKINALIKSRSHKTSLSHWVFFISKILVVSALEIIFHSLYSMHVFLLSFLIIEAAYAAMLQTVINEQMPSHSSFQPWQRVELFHIVVLVGGLALVLFFQFAENPFEYFKK